jgi:hypothetical protein
MPQINHLSSPALYSNNIILPFYPPNKTHEIANEILAPACSLLIIIEILLAGRVTQFSVE